MGYVAQDIDVAMNSGPTPQKERYMYIYIYI